MPDPRASISEEDVRSYLDGLLSPRPGRCVGIEIEFHVRDADPSAPRRTCDELRALLPGPLPQGGTLTFEPGGQLEISTSPASSIADACRSAAGDLAHVRHRLASSGLTLLGAGLEPIRPPQRMTADPRYAAMEAYFDRDGDAGRRMMCNTAAVQVHVDLGPDPDARWRLAHAIGPVLVASFANSPLHLGRPTGWRSGRIATWFEMDATRCGPVLAGADGSGAWADYALAAHVMLVRTPDSYIPAPPALRFQDWLIDGIEGGYPTHDDLAYHLTTLFPPVRPRGWLELRMIDALPDPWWRAAAAVAVALLLDPDAADEADVACRPVRGRWLDAARDGLADPALRGAAEMCFDAALRALPRLDADADTVQAVADYAHRFVDRGRTPADDILEAVTPMPQETPAWI